MTNRTKRPIGERLEALMKAQDLGQKISEFMNDPDVSGFFYRVRKNLIEEMIDCQGNAELAQKAEQIRAFDAIMQGLQGAIISGKSAANTHQKLIDKEDA